MSVVFYPCNRLFFSFSPLPRLLDDSRPGALTDLRSLLNDNQTSQFHSFLKMYKNTLILFSLLAVLVPANSAPLLVRHEGHDDAPAPGSGFVKQNGLDAQQQNNQFATMKATDSCQDGSNACINGGFASCLNGKWNIQSCSSGTKCYALPLVNKPGISLACDTEPDATARIATAIGDADGSPNSSVPAPSAATLAPSPSPSSPPAPQTGDSGDDCDDEPEDSTDDCDDGTSDPQPKTGDTAGGEPDCEDDEPPASAVPSSAAAAPTLATSPY